MRNDLSRLEKFRHTKEGATLASKTGDRFGVFYIENAGTGFTVIFDSGEPKDGQLGTGWEHAQLSVKQPSGDPRPPSWSEARWLKDLFWDDTEVVAQIYAKKVNQESGLHLWKPVGFDFPSPIPVAKP